jgi:hypothetical protein
MDKVCITKEDLSFFTGTCDPRKEKTPSHITERIKVYDREGKKAQLLCFLVHRAMWWSLLTRDSDPDSSRSVDPNPDPYSESGSGSRRAKNTHKSRKI